MEWQLAIYCSQKSKWQKLALCRGLTEPHLREGERREGGEKAHDVSATCSISLPAEGCTFLEHKSRVHWEHLAADKPYACSTGRPERPGGQRQAILLSISWAVCIHPLSLTNTWRKKLQAFCTFYHQVENAYRRGGKWFCLCPQLYSTIDPRPIQTSLNQMDSGTGNTVGQMGW